jgi:hypothetical protein
MGDFFFWISLSQRLPLSELLSGPCFSVSGDSWDKKSIILTSAELISAELMLNPLSISSA